MPTGAFPSQVTACDTRGKPLAKHVPRSRSWNLMIMLVLIFLVLGLIVPFLYLSTPAACDSFPYQELLVDMKIPEVFSEWKYDGPNFGTLVSEDELLPPLHVVGDYSIHTDIPLQVPFPGRLGESAILVVESLVGCEQTVQTSSRLGESDPVSLASRVYHRKQSSAVDNGLVQSLFSKLWTLVFGSASAVVVDERKGNHVYIRVAYFDSGGVELSSARSMYAADEEIVVLSALIPSKTQQIRVTIVSEHRYSDKNDGYARWIKGKIYFSPPATSSKSKASRSMMVQSVIGNSASIVWEGTNNNEMPVVSYWTEGSTMRDYSNVEITHVDHCHFVYKTELPSLLRGVWYYFQIQTYGRDNSRIFMFKSAPRREAPFTMAFIGHAFEQMSALNTLLRLASSREPDMVVMGGNVVRDGRVSDEFSKHLFSRLRYVYGGEKMYPTLFARGHTDGEGPIAYAYSALPGTGSWFAFDFGRSRIVVLDGNVLFDSPQQLQWLEKELQSEITREATFRVIVFHVDETCAWADESPEVSDNDESAKKCNQMMNSLRPVFEKHFVDLVITSHSGSYMRGERSGVTYVQVGGGSLSERFKASAHGYIGGGFGVHHYAMAKIDECELTWQVYDDRDMSIDSQVIKCHRHLFEKHFLAHHDEVVEESEDLDKATAEEREIAKEEEIDILQSEEEQEKTPS